MLTASNYPNIDFSIESILLKHSLQAVNNRTAETHVLGT